MNNSCPPGECTFYEVQRFRQLWVWIVVFFIAALSWYSFIQQIVFGEPFGNNPAPDWMVYLLLAIFGIIFPAWFLVMKLEVMVSDTRLSFRMFPLHPHWKEMAAEDLESAMAVVYRPFREFGGWGIRYGKQGLAYTVSGDRGVLVRLVSGRSFLLGSERPLELETALEDLIESKKQK
jgi:hypothetical protein